MNAVERRILKEVAGLHDIPRGAYNIRKNGEGMGRESTANIEIRSKEDKPGIDVIIKPGTKGESVHIPVIITETGLEDVVYNTFYVGEGSDVLIVAGCGIHNPGARKSQHDGIHDFIICRGARVRYVEKHYGEGEGTGGRVLNPKTVVEIEEGGYAEFELVQIKGVDSTKRRTEAVIHKNGHIVITERLLTHGNQQAESEMLVELVGENSAAQIVSRSVAQEESSQVFYPRMAGFAKCRGHVQCDAIIMDRAVVRAIPEIAAHHADAQLVHEAAIGKIAGEQIIKLMSLGLTEKEAEETILQGFLK
ncbi:MAG: SufD family Fe-S cluster assembly protein [Peptococcaceae bacterium]|jgi:Fe-S cluster assembly scaffold protein SufB|nr:SufD family Fe-S cluster assembly protein [Peptococcaceae bacterium]MDH7525400.1 SufD family Fe-S cluster assembly protein [Peptococcaceae bacterium]